MKIEKVTGNEERRILIGMIVDPLVCGKLAAKWEPELFRSKWANIVGEWCTKFFNQYREAPRGHIQGMFESWATKHKDKDTISLVERFLSGLSEEYESLAKESNTEYILDVAAKHFTKNKATRLAELVQGDLDGGELESALKRISQFGAVEVSGGSGVDVMQDENAVLAAFAEKKEPLIIYPGAVGEFFKDAFERDSFIALLAPEKRGKTWWLIDVAWRAMLQRRRVAFFSVGDMSQNQMMRRLMIRASRNPLKGGKYKVPTAIEFAEDQLLVSHEEKDAQPLDPKTAFAACKKVMSSKVKSDRSFFRLSTHPNSSISVKGIESILRTWEREGWVADVVVIDYADILMMPDGGDEARNQINATWKHLRSLSQVFHCCVVTATQADAAGGYEELLGRRNFSEDKRKFAHVTGMLGLNQTDDEKRDGVYRLNWIVLREGEFSERLCCYTAGSLAIGNPCIKSFLPGLDSVPRQKDVDAAEEREEQGGRSARQSRSNSRRGRD